MDPAWFACHELACEPRLTNIHAWAAAGDLGGAGADSRPQVLVR